MRPLPEMDRRSFTSPLFICIIILIIAALLVLRGPTHRIRVGEQQTYGIYSEDNKIGTLVIGVENVTSIENVEGYLARYSLEIGSIERLGELKFEKGIWPRHTNITLTENGSLEWATEISYSFSADLMYVIVKDNRDPENYRETDNYLAFSERIMTPEHLWYILRFTSLHLGNRQEFYLHLLPDATENLTIAMEVVDKEEIETQAGYFVCWVLEGENTNPIHWPIDELWIAKGERLVIKAVKKQAEGPDVTYVLEEKM